MDTWFRKKFILVRPFPREMSLKFAVSSVRNIVPSGTKVGKSAFGRARFNAPFCTRCTHTHTYTVNEVTKIHPVNRVRDATSPQKGSKLSFFYFSIEKNKHLWYPIPEIRAYIDSIIIPRFQLKHIYLFQTLYIQYSLKLKIISLPFLSLFPFHHPNSMNLPWTDREHKSPQNSASFNSFSREFGEGGRARNVHEQSCKRNNDCA